MKVNNLKQEFIDFAKYAIDFENFDIEFTAEQLVEDYFSKYKLIVKVCECDNMEVPDHGICTECKKPILINTFCECNKPLTQ